MSSSDKAGKPPTPQENPRQRWTTGVIVAGVSVIAVTVAVAACGPSSQPNAESQQDSKQTTEPEGMPDRAAAECEADEDEQSDEEERSTEAMSPSGEYFATTNPDPTLHHDGDSTKIIDSEDDDHEGNSFPMIKVNSSGVAIGYERDPADPTKGWRYADGEKEELSLPDGWKGLDDLGVRPTGINDDGVVVGYVEGESDGEERTAPAKWEPGSQTPTLFDTDHDGVAQAVDGDTVIGYEKRGDEQQLVKWNSDGDREDWEGPSGKDIEPYVLNNDWTVYGTDDGPVRLNLSNDKEDELPDGFNAVDHDTSQVNLDDEGNVYGYYETGHAGYISPDGEDHEIAMSKEDEHTNATKEGVAESGDPPVVYRIRAVSADGSKLVGARQVEDDEGQSHNDSGARVWECDAS